MVTPNTRPVRKLIRIHEMRLPEAITAHGLALEAFGQAEGGQFQAKWMPVRVKKTHKSKKTVIQIRFIGSGLQPCGIRKGGG
jgi:hypothetical protein